MTIIDLFDYFRHATFQWIIISIRKIKFIISILCLTRLATDFSIGGIVLQSFNRIDTLSNDGSVSLCPFPDL